MTPNEAEQAIKERLGAVSVRHIVDAGVRSFLVEWEDFRHAASSRADESLEDAVRWAIFGLSEWIEKKRKAA